MLSGFCLEILTARGKGIENLMVPTGDLDPSFLDFKNSCFASVKWDFLTTGPSVFTISYLTYFWSPLVCRFFVEWRIPTKLLVSFDLPSMSSLYLLWRTCSLCLSTSSDSSYFISLSLFVRLIWLNFSSKEGVTGRFLLPISFFLLIFFKEGQSCFFLIVGLLDSGLCLSLSERSCISCLTISLDRCKCLGLPFNSSRILTSFFSTSVLNSWNPFLSKSWVILWSTSSKCRKSPAI